MTGTPISVKEKTFETEARFLSPYAKKSCETKGRARAEAPCEFRTDFQRDRDRIIYSNSFKRLKNKTQVFFAPEGDHYITRLTHTLDVAQISRSIARGALIERGSRGSHRSRARFGAYPFRPRWRKGVGQALAHGFRAQYSVSSSGGRHRKGGAGLNLTEEVRDGILQHKSTGHPPRWKARRSRWRTGSPISITTSRTRSGRDSQRFGSAAKRRGSAGTRTRERINTAITDIYTQSLGQPFVRMSEKVAAATKELRGFMFEKVYALTNKSMQERAERMLTEMFEYFMKHTERLPAQYVRLSEISSKEQIICDYLSGMTDRYAIDVFEDLFIPETFSLGGVKV